MSDEKHCETCICGRRAPMQADSRTEKNPRPHPAGTVAWSEFLLAMAEYTRQYGTQQGPERMAERGGLSWGELVMFLGRDPETWEPLR